MDEQYQDAITKGFYGPAIVSYYAIMAELITASYGRFWHFSPKHDPKLHDRNQGVESLHKLISSYLCLDHNQKVMELGCGYGRCAEWMARYTGADVTGMTLSPNEVEFASRQYRLSNLRIIEGDYHKIPTQYAGTMDSMYAVYCLKYSCQLRVVLQNIYDTLKPGGTFLSYEILTTKKYNPSDAKQRKKVETISTSTNMPPLHSVTDFEEAAKSLGFEVIIVNELSSPNDEWYDCFVETAWYSALKSPFTHWAVYLLEKVGFLQRGFYKFFDLRLVHPLVDFVETGRDGVVTGSTIMLFRKPF